jgi:hypothetical protein
MTKLIRQFCFVLAGFLFLSRGLTTAQNENSKWYFGINAGLDFMTTPPTILTNGALSTMEGSASISDEKGNLLFYTNGATVYNRLHQQMANGTGLNGGPGLWGGNPTTTQGALITRQPGSCNIYYLFTLASQSQSMGLCYSIVDMNLAAGTGSVTIKNAYLFGPSTEKLCGVRHCNGIDAWIITHDYNSNNFRAYLLTAAGVNTVPVLSSIGTVPSANSTTNSAGWVGEMEASPDGKRLVVCNFYPNNTVELYDFDKTTGIVSNSLILATFATTPSICSPYGCEFSPDGSKVYACSHQNCKIIYQWNLSAGTNNAIVASQTSVGAAAPGQVNFYNNAGALQLATNGKIYVARGSMSTLGVINNPNAAGQTCNYVDNGQSLGSSASDWGLPNFIKGPLNSTPVSSFTSSVSCRTASVNFPVTTGTGCIASNGNPVNNVQWNFGDPGSGSNNTATGFSASHLYSSAGNYQVQLILYKNCGSDTITQQVVISGSSVPSLSITGNVNICKGKTTNLTVSGANTYSWSYGSGLQMVTLSPSATTSYTVIGTNTMSGCSAVQTITLKVTDCTGLEEANTDHESFRIFPNPNSGNPDIETLSGIRVVVFDDQGRAVFEADLSQGKHTIDLRHLRNGIYQILVVSEGNSKTQRIIKNE